MGNWTDTTPRIAIIGAGRLGTALTAALQAAGLTVSGPHGRGSDGAGADAVLLCVPDAQIPVAAAAVRPGTLVGHCSGATGLGALARHEAFGLHPLMTVTAGGAVFAGAGCAIAGTSDRSLELARHLALTLGMTPFEIADDDRAAYHAAASVASNLLVALEGAAERLAATAGVPREALAPLVRASADNWARQGARRALTGPIARGDEATVALQREAIAERTPDLVPLFDVLAAQARTLTERPEPAPPRITRTIDGVRVLLDEARRHGRTIGLVPTMGALHDGHLALIERARADHDVVVVSVFVNPAQFNDAADLAAYPRGERRDAELAFAAGADVLFAPGPSEIFPDGFATTVTVSGPLTHTLEGEHRGSGHFDGVTTVVSKLFTIVGPDAAYFGQKDAQQLAVVRRMAADLDLRTRIVACPTVRDGDGLALSSRNTRLSDAGRQHALSLSRTLQQVAAAIGAGELRHGPAITEAGLAALRAGGADPEYFTAVDPATLEPVREVAGDVLLVTAAHVEDVRLIDNLTVGAAAPASPSGSSTLDARAATATAAATQAT